MTPVNGMAKKSMLKRIFFVAGVLLTVLMPGAHDSMATTAAQRSEIKVNLRDGTLSVHINNMPLVDILQIIGDDEMGVGPQ